MNNRKTSSGFIKHKVIKPLYKRVFQTSLDCLKKELLNCGSVLDLGCGFNSPVKGCGIPFSVGVDLFDSYLRESRDKGYHSQYVKADIRKVEFLPKAFDAVTILEVLEHLTKEDGCKLIEKAEMWAAKKIIISTPNGYLSQDGYHSNPLQKHISGWTPKELQALGFKVYGMKGWKKLRGYKGTIVNKPVFLWERFSDITQKITYRYPGNAFQLLAVKNVLKKNEDS